MAIEFGNKFRPFSTRIACNTYILSQHTSISCGLGYLLGNFTCPLDALHCVLVHFYIYFRWCVNALMDSRMINHVPFRPFGQVGYFGNVCNWCGSGQLGHLPQLGHLSILRDLSILVIWSHLSNLSYLRHMSYWSNSDNMGISSHWHLPAIWAIAAIPTI